MSLSRPATHRGEDLNRMRWSYPISGSRTAPSGGVGRLPVHAINYHPSHANPALQKHTMNWQEGSKYYRQFPLSMQERADPRFGMSESNWCLWWYHHKVVKFESLVMSCFTACCDCLDAMNAVQSFGSIHALCLKEYYEIFSSSHLNRLLS